MLAHVTTRAVWTDVDRKRVAALAAVVWLQASTPDSVQAQGEYPEGVCRVYGTVIDADLATPVAGASVWLERTAGRSGLQAARTTSTAGTFQFDLQRCDPLLLRVQIIGFADSEELLDFSGGPGAYEITIRLRRTPVELEELRVEVGSSLRLQEAGFYARRAWVESTGRDYGDFFEPDDVAGRARAIHSVGAMAMRSRIRFVYGGCRPSVYIDGRRHPRRSNFWEWVDMHVKPEDVEGMEIYRSTSAAVPMEFRDFESSRCGALVIWTKNGASPHATDSRSSPP